MSLKNFWIAAASLLLVSALCTALTPQERQAIQKARTELRAGASQYKKAQEATAAADARAAASDKYAQDTYALALKTQSDIDAAYKREQALVAEVNDLRGLRDRVYAHWGLGAFAVGFGILTKHLLILAAVIIVVLVGIYALSFAFPLFGIVWKVVWRGIGIAGKSLLSLLRAGFNAARRLFNKPPPPS